MSIRLDGVGVQVEVSQGDGKTTRKTLLADLDLTLEERRIVIIGANGSGKSTLLRLLNGLITPTTGHVLVNGFDTLTEARKVRQQVGFIFTDPLSQLVMSTPVEDIELSLRKAYPKRAEREAKALALLAERGLEHVARQSIYNLSGGERQLVALTTVLAVNPSILVADEPTTLLDLRNKLRLREVFTGLDQQLIFSTHDLEVAEDAERALVIDGGRCVFDGVPSRAIDHYRGLLLR